jgi:hypothetical protein
MGSPACEALQHNIERWRWKFIWWYANKDTGSLSTGNTNRLSEGCERNGSDYDSMDAANFRLHGLDYTRP